MDSPILRLGSPDLVAQLSEALAELNNVPPRETLGRVTARPSTETTAPTLQPTSPTNIATSPKTEKFNEDPLTAWSDMFLPDEPLLFVEDQEMAEYYDPYPMKSHSNSANINPDEPSVCVEDPEGTEYSSPIEVTEPAGHPIPASLGTDEHVVNKDREVEDNSNSQVATAPISRPKWARYLSVTPFPEIGHINRNGELVAHAKWALDRYPGEFRGTIIPSIEIRPNLCWRCGHLGHFRDSCQGHPRLFCSRCGTIGIMSRECGCAGPDAQDRCLRKTSRTSTRRRTCHRPVQPR